MGKDYLLSDSFFKYEDIFRFISEGGENVSEFREIYLKINEELRFVFIISINCVKICAIFKRQADLKLYIDKGLFLNNLKTVDHFLEYVKTEIKKMMYIFDCELRFGTK